MKQHSQRQQPRGTRTKYLITRVDDSVAGLVPVIVVPLVVPVENAVLCEPRVSPLEPHNPQCTIKSHVNMGDAIENGPQEWAGSDLTPETAQSRTWPEQDNHRFVDSFGAHETSLPPTRRISWRHFCGIGRNSPGRVDVRNLLSCRDANTVITASFLPAECWMLPLPAAFANANQLSAGSSAITERTQNAASAAHATTNPRMAAAVENVKLVDDALHNNLSTRLGVNNFNKTGLASKTLQA
jgi:hypothetical protein